MVDLKEEGLSEKEALARIQATIKDNPALDDFDNLIEAPEERKRRSERWEEDEANGEN